MNSKLDFIAKAMLGIMLGAIIALFFIAILGCALSMVIDVWSDLLVEWYGIQ